MNEDAQADAPALLLHGPSPADHRRRLRTFIFMLAALVFMAGLLAAFVPALPELRLFGDVISIRILGGALIFWGFAMVFVIVAQGYLRDGVLNPFATPDPRLMESRAELKNVWPELEQLEFDASPPTPSPAETLLNNLTLRLEIEIRNQDRKANTNLLIGGVGALVALVILATSVFLPPHAANPTVFWAMAGARGLLSCTASIFAFFFLSTYRRNLSESRYFHNELTNVEAKLLAIHLHRETKLSKPDRGDATVLEMLKELAATERNFILRKGETTTDLQQKDIDRQEHDALLAALSALAAQAAPSRSTPTARRKT